MRFFLRKLVLLALILLPATAYSKCVQPFISSDTLGSDPRTSGLAFPLSTDLVRYANCSTENCLLRAEILESGSVSSEILVQYLPTGTDLGFLNDKKFNIIGEDNQGNAVFATSAKLDDGIYLRTDFVKNENEVTALSVKHYLHDNYPKIETLQAFIRQSIVVCN